MKNKILLTCLLIIGAITLSFAQDKHDSDEGNWVVIATKDVAFKKGEKDKITPYGKERNVSKIKIKCTQGTLKLKKVHVEMEDGTKKEYSAKGIGVLNKGMSSFAFDLPGKDKKLKTIEIEYDAVGNILLTKRAKVEILGKKRNDK